jgi:hypothetical protein
VTLYAAKLGHARLAANSQATQSRLAKLESRTAGIDSGMPVALLPGVISSSYTTGDPMVLVNGAATATGPYKYLTSYTPVANDPVILAPVGGSMKAYIVIGKQSA